VIVFFIKPILDLVEISSSWELVTKANNIAAKAVKPKHPIQPLFFFSSDFFFIKKEGLPFNMGQLTLSGASSKCFI
tara:strand:+ start:452 stop:679 length:228 start_codon:yes stop_codon:yes gene_type:complete